MYRKNQTGGFRSPLIEQQSNLEGKDDSKLADELSDNPVDVAGKIRKTRDVLNLFKKPISNSVKGDEEDNVGFKPNDTENNVTENSPPIVASNDKLVFNVVIGKQSTRKHKKWDDDGILEVNGKSAVLMDSDGKVLRRTTVNPDTLVEGFRIYVDNKVVEIIERVHSGNASSNHTESKEMIVEPPRKKQKFAKNQFLPVGSKKGLTLTNNQLIMPALNNSKNWLKECTFEKEQEKVSVDACLANVLRPHQRFGVVFLYECLMGIKIPNYYGAILADEMGLGKTLQCITIIWTLLKKGPHGKPVVKRVLIVTPSSLCKNWNKEFVHWLGYHRITPYVIDAKKKPKDFKKQPRCSVMIISYDMLIRNCEEIEELNFDLIVCDEGHRLKNSDIKAAKFLYNMACKRRILLTGTPIQNDLQEFYSLADFVNPGILGTNHDYKINYEHPIVASRSPDASDDTIMSGREKAEELHELTKSFVLRRTQDTINKYLPSKHEIVVLCRLSREQEELYSLVTDAWFKKTVVPGNNIPHLSVVTSLKKICNHTDLFVSSKNEFLQQDSVTLSKIQQIKKNLESNQMAKYCGKVTVVQTLMRHLKKTNEKLVLISYYTQTLNLLESICNTEGLKFLRLDGSTSSIIRCKIVEKFNSATDDHKVFLLSGKAGGLGLNLPGASRLVLFDSDWNPASDAQAMARIWREGQKRDVYIYRLLTAGTIEEKIFQRQITKTGLSETIVDLNSFASLKFSLIELRDLFTLTTDTSCVTHDLMKCTCAGDGKNSQSTEQFELGEERECQLVLQDKSSQLNLTINQLLEWEHYKQPVPTDIMKEVMLMGLSDNVTFLFKHSKVRCTDGI